MKKGEYRYFSREGKSSAVCVYILFLGLVFEGSFSKAYFPGLFVLDIFFFLQRFNIGDLTLFFLDIFSI